MALREADCVNPACAGMIRRARPVCRWAICKPRVCGDDPGRDARTMRARQ